MDVRPAQRARPRLNRLNAADLVVAAVTLIGIAGLVDTYRSYHGGLHEAYIALGSHVLVALALLWVVVRLVLMRRR